MKSIIFALLFSVAFADQITELCKQKYDAYRITRTATDYPTTFLPKYGRNVAKVREAAFMNNCIKIETHNRLENQTYWMAINRFTDWTDEEFQSFLNFRPETLPIDNLKTPPIARPVNQTQVTGHHVVGDVDLRKYAWVNGVRDQGGCGSCWAFAAVGAMEMNYGRIHGRVEGSEQWVVDCDGRSGGCNGGMTNAAFDMVKGHGGSFANRYGYDGYHASKGGCHDPSSWAGKIDNYYQLNGEGDVFNWVNAEYAVTAYVNANNWNTYGGGVFNGDCGGAINHAVIIVGWGADFWLIRNSWSGNWGEGGYIKIRRDQNKCNVGSYNLLVCQGHPAC